jgi:hypothetical protein
VTGSAEGGRFARELCPSKTHIEGIGKDVKLIAQFDAQTGKSRRISAQRDP